MKNFEPLHVIDSQGGHVYSLVVSNDYIIAGTYENCILVCQRMPLFFFKYSYYSGAFNP